MTPNPFANLVTSRKFWLMILDLVVSLALYFTAKYASASAVEDVKVVILAVQPVFITVIGALAYENGKTIQAESRLRGEDAERAQR